MTRAFLNYGAPLGGNFREDGGTAPLTWLETLIVPFVLQQAVHSQAILAPLGLDPAPFPSEGGVQRVIGISVPTGFMYL